MTGQDSKDVIASGPGEYRESVAVLDSGLE